MVESCCTWSVWLLMRKLWAVGTSSVPCQNQPMVHIPDNSDAVAMKSTLCLGLEYLSLKYCKKEIWTANRSSCSFRPKSKAIKSYTVRGGIAPLFLNLSTRWRRVASFTVGERATGTHWIGGWGGPRAYVDVKAKRKMSADRCSRCLLTSSCLN